MILCCEWKKKISTKMHFTHKRFALFSFFSFRCLLFWNYFVFFGFMIPAAPLLFTQHQQQNWKYYLYVNGNGNVCARFPLSSQMIKCILMRNFFNYTSRMGEWKSEHGKRKKNNVTRTKQWKRLKWKNLHLFIKCWACAKQLNKYDNTHKNAIF